MALYNKYRPTNLKHVCGQEHVKRVLVKQFESNDPSHAYLFTGPAGTGKTTLARIVASCVNCSSGITADPSIDDVNVKAIFSGDAMDVMEIDAASSRGIDDAKKLREIVHLPPMQMRKRVFIIDECHQLTTEAWSVLLKMVEEPPPYSMFIFCTTELGKVLETIQTRCLCFSFRPLLYTDIISYLKGIAVSEKISIEDEALAMVAISSRGSLRDAMSKLDKLKQENISGKITADYASGVVGVPSRNIVRRYIESILSNGGIATSIEVSSEAIGIGVSSSDFLREVANICHDLLIVTGKNVSMERFGYTSNEAEELKGLACKIKDGCGPENFRKLLDSWIDICEAWTKSTIYNTNPQAAVNVAWVSMWTKYHDSRKLGQIKK